MKNLDDTTFRLQLENHTDISKWTDKQILMAFVKAYGLEDFKSILNTRTYGSRRITKRENVHGYYYDKFFISSDGYLVGDDEKSFINEDLTFNGMYWKNTAEERLKDIIRPFKAKKNLQKELESIPFKEVIKKKVSKI